MRVLGLIPARGGSRRVPRKNLARLGDKTLVRRAVETAVDAGCFGAVALSSEDPEILAEVEGTPALAVERPPELASDTSLALDAVIHALDTVAGDWDAVAIIQATSPFTEPQDLRAAVELMEHTGAGSVVSVTRVEAREHPLKLKVLEGDRLRPWLEDDRMTPSHELPQLWVRNGSVYVTRTDILRSGEIVDPNDQRAFEMPPERSFDIDTPRDLAFAELLVSKGR
ncbi:MAG: cytidylyltransferase domain-containing protein [Thermoleophilaceae bacterium]